MRIEEVIGRTIPLVPKGHSDRYMVPESGEPSSMVVDTLYGWFFWHARGLRGNKYDWLRLVEGMSDADIKAMNIGGDVIQERPREQQTRPLDPILVERFSVQLMRNRDAIKYLCDRGITRRAAEHFRLGYCSWYRGCIAIPHFFADSLVGVKLRIIDGAENRRYRAIPGSNFGIYNYGSGHRVIVEGEFKAIWLWQIGVDAMALPAGQLSATIEEQLGWLSGPLLYVRDNDSAGLASAVKLSKLLGDKLQTISTPSEKSVDDYLREFGVTQWVKETLAP